MPRIPRASVVGWLLAPLAGAVGFALSLFGLPVFGTAELRLTSLPALLILFTLGMPKALLAVAIASIGELLAGRVWVPPIHLFEILAVGFLIRRGDLGRIVSAFLFWSCCGAPGAALAGSLAKHYPFPDNWAEALTLPLGGLVSALAAASLADLFQSESPGASPPLRRLLLRRISAAAFLGTLSIGLLAAYALSSSSNTAAISRLQSDAGGLANLIDGHLRKHAALIEEAAQRAADAETIPEVEEILESLRTRRPGFITLLAADSGGQLVASSPARPGGGSISDREYFTEALKRKEAWVGDALRGRGFGRDRIIPISCAARDATGSVRFVLQGALDANLSALAESTRANHLRLVDSSGLVVHSKGALVEPPLGKAAELPASGTAVRRNPATNREETFRTASAGLTHTGWKVTVAEPSWDVDRGVAESLGKVLVLLSLSGCLAALLAQRTAGDITLPLGQLARSIETLSLGKIDPDPQRVRCPARELESISAAVRAATQHLCSANQGLAAALLERDRTHAELLTVMRGLDDTVKLRTAELEAAVQRAESASRSKSEFVASTSHELRTPLNVIIGMSELLIDRSLGELNARQLEAAQAVEEAGRHLLSLINDILDLSKIEAGKLEIDLQPTSIRDACEASLRLVRHPAAEKRHFIAESLDVRHDTIPADPRRLKQMLVNLLSNAVKFTPDGGRVILQVSELENPPETHFTVADTGIGIAAEDLPRLFQPFQQLESSLSRRFGGTGLGLVLVRRLAELHGGRIEVYSKPGEGSRFTVVLPTAGRVSEESQQQVDDYKELAPGTRILVADPSVPDQFIYRNCPAFAHCQIEFASTASEALGSAFSRTPDLMLMDPELPGMEPIRLIQLLRTDPRTATTPIILACAPPSPSEATRFKEAGVSALVSKPVRIRDLETTAAQLAGSSRARIP